MLDKIKILSDSAKYDVSCSSSGSNRSAKGKLGNTSVSGICHSWSADGRCVSLLKILMSNYCIYDCAYCINRKSNDIPRAMFTPDEICELTINFYRKNYIEGLFLSTGIVKNPDYTMELLIQTIKKLRLQYNFYGYIHVKLIPGASLDLIQTAGKYADRVSVNIELPSDKSLSLLAPQKNIQSIVTPMKKVKESLDTFKLAKNNNKNTLHFSPAGQSTQLIIGATPESDFQILRLSQWLYKNVDLKRVYYSAYVPVNKGQNLPAILNPPLLREQRLYQADWLLRFYNFEADELLNPNYCYLDSDLDPKTSWALRNIDIFPIDINKADYNTLLRVPGIGVRSVNKIVRLRKAQQIKYDDLKKLGIVLKRAKYFITVNGKYHSGTPLNPVIIKNQLTKIKTDSKQLDFWQNNIYGDLSAVTGEL